jgi:tripartite-type tricarboxylate transporter receptor subunit TctC
MTIALCATAGAARADEFPSRPIHIVIGFPPGIGIDLNARILAQLLSTDLGQSVIVENRPGAAGMIAAQLVLHAPRDGYTLLAINNQHYNNELMYSSVSYKKDDFIPVAGGSIVSMVLMTSKALPAASLSDVIRIAKDKPGEVSYGYWGAGGSPQILAKKLEASSGISLLGIGYKEAANAMPDLIAGRISLFFTSVTQGLPLYKSSVVNFLAVGSPKRLPGLPDVPTFAESGLAEMPDAWSGYAVPAGTPPAVVDKLTAAITNATSTPEYRERLAETGTVPLVMESRAAFSAFVDDEFERWASVIRPLNLHLN